MLIEHKTLGQTARGFRQNGYEAPLVDPLKQDYQNPQDALKVWDYILKRERFALVADLLDQSIREVPTPNINLLSSKTPYEDLSGSLRLILSSGIEAKLLEPTVRTSSIYQRFETWVNFHNQNLLQTADHQKCGVLTTSEAITKGLDVALPWMGITLKMIPLVSEKEELNLTREQLLQTAKNSHSFLGKLASQDILTLNCIGFTIAEMLQSESEEINPSAFTILDKYQRPTLDFSHLTKQEINHRLSSKTKYTSRLGCPALINFSDKSSLARIWDFYLQSARKLY